MIYITGDCHGNFERFNVNIFPEQKEMTKEDYVIICRDFGGVWNKLEEVRQNVKYQKWFFGHYHDNRNVSAEEILLWEQMIRIA